MQAQKRRLQHGSIGNYNKAMDIEQKKAIAAARMQELRANPNNVRVAEIRNMPIS